MLSTDVETDAQVVREALEEWLTKAFRPGGMDAPFAALDRILAELQQEKADHGATGNIADGLVREREEYRATVKRLSAELQQVKDRTKRAEAQEAMTDRAAFEQGRELAALRAENERYREANKAVRQKLGDYPNDRVAVLRQHLNEIDRLTRALAPTTQEDRQ